MQSVFIDKNKAPSEKDLQKALSKTVSHWNALVEFVIRAYPNAKLEWKYSGEKYGWSFQLKDSKRAIIYLLPRDGFFKVAFVFGQKATDDVLSSKVSDVIKDELKAAKKYAEGRGIRIDVSTSKLLPDIKKLIDIKLKH
jgi:hypothetical protein